MNKLSVVIQAGGRSSRMGQDKGLLPFQGTTLTQYILNQVEGYGDETFIISNQPEQYAQFGVPIHTDAIPGYGALGGIYSALYHSSNEQCLILACDMPFIIKPLLDHLVGVAEGYDAVIPRIDPDQLAEPFRAVYRKTCLPVVKFRMEANELKVSDFLEDVNVRFVENKEIQQFDPSLRTFFNVNTPEDLKLAEKMAEDDL